MSKYLRLTLEKHIENKKHLARKERALEGYVASLVRPWRGLRPLRFWEKVRIQGACWLWDGPVNNDTPSYNAKIRTKGTTWVKYPRLSARQLVWGWYTGQLQGIPSRVTVACGTPNCIRPGHLRAGTRLRSGKEGRREGPLAVPQPPNVHWGKYTPAQWLSLVPDPREALQKGDAFPLQPIAFWRSVRVGVNGCWDWMGSVTKDGVGYWCRWTAEGMQKTEAHRAVLTFFHGDAFNKLRVHRVCQNLRCVNPQHIERGRGHFERPVLYKYKRQQERLKKLQAQEFEDPGL